MPKTVADQMVETLSAAAGASPVIPSTPTYPGHGCSGVKCPGLNKEWILCP